MKVDISKKELKKAIIMNEILSKPISLRKKESKTSVKSINRRR
jgi:hypothetical protein